MPPMRRLFITCAGEATRWGEHLGVPKHLAPVDGVPLLHRTVQQLRSRGATDVHVVAQSQRLAVPGTRHVTPRHSRWLVETVLSTEPLWVEENIFLLGDVCFTPESLDTILNDIRPVAVFGREGSSKITGHPYGEIFALRFTAAESPIVRATLRTAVRLASMARGEQRCGGVWRTAVILLADMQAVFSNGGGGASLQTALRLLSDRGPAWAPALAGSRSSLWSVLRLVLAAIRMVRGRRIHQLGRMWSFYRLYTSQLLFAPLCVDNGVFVRIDDRTDDFDTPQDYERWLSSRGSGASSVPANAGSAATV